MLSQLRRLILPKRRVSVIHAHAWHTDKYGNILWVEPGYRHNILHDEGERYILSNSFDTDHADAGVPTNLFLGLDNRASGSIAEDNVLPIAEEPTTGGYARQQISTASGFTLSQPGNYYQAQSTTVTFTASGGDIGTVSNRFIATTVDDTGLLVCTLPLQTARTLTDTDNLNVSITIGLSEPA